MGAPLTLDSFHVMSKPTGATCNLDCAYCFFLKKEKLYPGSSFTMTDEVMRAYIRQTVESQESPHVTIAWQGGEPTLMGLDFFRRVALEVKKYERPGRTIENTLQTNGTLLTPEWCAFLRENRFLVGISLDGPAHLHDIYRRDKRDRPTFDKVLRGIRLLQEYGVAYNLLCTVNAMNVRHPLEVYRFFRDELGVEYIQFIPIVERDNDTGFQEGTTVTERTVPSLAWGEFLTAIFDEWLSRDVGRVYVTFFDAVLASYVYGESTVCVLQPTCGRSLALEHNGDLYACDHFVEPKHLLGNLLQTPMAEMISGPQQKAFGEAKSTTLPRECRECPYLFTCHGECPKNRILTTADGEPGLNWLCAGLKMFFAHTEGPMREMAGLLKEGRYADEIMGKKAPKQ